jgi:hypothetical protein
MSETELVSYLSLDVVLISCRDTDKVSGQQKQLLVRYAELPGNEEWSKLI